LLNATPLNKKSALAAIGGKVGKAGYMDRACGREEFGAAYTGSDDDDMGSIRTMVPHELKRADEEGEDEIEWQEEQQKRRHYDKEDEGEERTGSSVEVGGLNWWALGWAIYHSKTTTNYVVGGSSVFGVLFPTPAQCGVRGFDGADFWMFDFRCKRRAE
jgi:hypothetical protein